MGPGSALAVLACPGRQRVCGTCVAVPNHSFAFSRHDLPELCTNILPRRGSRECRVRAAPAVSCAKLHKEKRTRAYRFSGDTPAFPAQWLYGLCRAPRRRIRLVTVVGGSRLIKLG